MSVTATVGTGHGDLQSVDRSYEALMQQLQKYALVLYALLRTLAPLRRAHEALSLVQVAPLLVLVLLSLVPVALVFSGSSYFSQ